jgi:hypothetical protein
MSSSGSDDDLASDLNISVDSLQLSIGSLFSDTETDFSEQSDTEASEAGLDEALKFYFHRDEEDSSNSESSDSSNFDSPPAKRKYEVIFIRQKCVPKFSHFP